MNALIIEDAKPAPGLQGYYQMRSELELLRILSEADVIYWLPKLIHCKILHKRHKTNQRNRWIFPLTSTDTMIDSGRYYPVIQIKNHTDE